MPIGKAWTEAAIIQVLGGTTAVARLTGRRYNAVAGWRQGRGFPTSLFLIMTRALIERGVYDAPPELWGMETEARAKEVA